MSVLIPHVNHSLPRTSLLLSSHLPPFRMGKQTYTDGGDGGGHSGVAPSSGVLTDPEEYRKGLRILETSARLGPELQSAMQSRQKRVHIAFQVSVGFMNICIGTRIFDVVGVVGEYIIFESPIPHVKGICV